MSEFDENRNLWCWTRFSVPVDEVLPTYLEIDNEQTERSKRWRPVLKRLLEAQGVYMSKWGRVKENMTEVLLVSGV